MIRTPILRAQASSIPFLQTFIPPQRLATAIPASSVIRFRRITHYNQFDEIEVVSKNGTEVRRKFWAAGTRETVTELMRTPVPPTTKGEAPTSVLSLKIVYNGPARPIFVREPKESVEADSALGTGTRSAELVVLDVQPDAEGRTSEFFAAFEGSTEEEDEQLDELDELSKSFVGIGPPPSRFK